MPCMIIFLSIASVLGIKTKIKKNKNIRRIEKPSFYRGLFLSFIKVKKLFWKKSNQRIMEYCPEVGL